MRNKALEPGELVIEFRPRLWIAVRRVYASDDDTVESRFEITRVVIAGSAGQPASNLNWFGPACENGHAVIPRLLPLPQRAITRFAYGIDRKLFVIDAQFL